MNTKKFTATTSALVLGATLFIAALKLKITPHYSDFLVGRIAWDAGTKIQDLIAWPAFILASFFGSLALSKIASSIREGHSCEVFFGFLKQLVLWSLPFYATVGSLFLGPTLDTKPIFISALGLTSIAVIAFFNRKNKGKFDPDFCGAILLSIVLISLIPIEIAILLSRVPMSLVGNLRVVSPFKVSSFLIVIGFLAGTLALIKYRSSPHPGFIKLFFAGQIGLPFFFLTLYPSRILLPSGAIVKYNTTIYLKALIVAFIIYGTYDVLKRFRPNLRDRDWRRLFSPFALFGLLVGLKTGVTITPKISADDYHFGEHLIGYLSYSHGFIPYVNYIPPHGFIDDDLRAFFASIFYDGTAASIGEAGRSALAVLSLFSFMSIYYFTGNLILAFVAIFLLGGRFSWFFLVPFICLWLSSILRAQPAKWLSVWMLTAPVVILGTPAPGLLLVAAFGFLALKMIWDQIRIGDKESWRCLGLTFVSLLFLLTTTSLLTMLAGAIQYVLENGPINQVTYGIPWSLSWNTSRPSGLVLEVIRMSWIAIPLSCLYVIYKYWRDFNDSRSSFYHAIIFLVFLLFLIPYSMGRLDPGHLSRPGLVSILGWTVLFPLLIWNTLTDYNRVFVVLSVVFMSSLLGFRSTSLSSLFSSAAQTVRSPTLTDATKAGLPNIGLAYVDKNQWNHISRLNALIKSKLSTDETYLDLTSRNAHYFYLNRLPPLPITAPYNLAPREQQKRAIEALAVSPPKIALLQADNITHDGGGLALRNPYLYKFVINNYIPRMESGFIIGYRNSGKEEHVDNKITAEIRNITNEDWIYGFGRHEAAIVLSDPVLVSMLKTGNQIRFPDGETRVIKRISDKQPVVWLSGDQIPPPDTSDQNLVDITVSPNVCREYTASLFQRSFSVSDLKKIPVSWGRSEKSLRAKMTSIRNLDGISPRVFDVSSENGVYEVKGSDPKVIYDISDFGLSGRDAGLLRFDFKCFDRKVEPRIQIFWWGDERKGAFEESSFKFSAENGTLIVPLDASPWWLILHRIKGIRFDLDNPAACRAISVKNITLYQRQL